MPDMETFYSYRRDLPHWRALGATYFVTFRVHRTQPFLAAWERTEVLDALRAFHETRYALGAHVVMDDHVHAVVTPREGHPLTRTVGAWKSYSARRICARSAREAPLWQASYYDRIVRGDRELAAVTEYVLSNPWKRWPSLEAYRWVAATGGD